MPRKRKRSSPEPQADLTLLPDVQLRIIRPRPLPYDEKLRVWSLEDPDFDTYNPQLARCVRERVALAHALQEKSKSGSKRKNEEKIEKKIQVPGYRLLKNAPTVSDANGLSTQKPLEERAYIRHIEKSQEELEDQVEYDLDSEDEHWLDKRHQKGLEDLNAELLETLMDRFEKAKHAVLDHQQGLWERDGPSRTGIPPEERAPGVLYPTSNAISDFGGEYSSLLLRAAHNYWAEKAGKSKTPLLQRFWYDKRWARQNALKTRREEVGHDDDDEDSGGVPFQGKETPQKSLRGRTLASEDVGGRLMVARADLEALRTLADQVKRREKVRRRYLQAWEHELRVSVALSNKAKTPKPKLTPTASKSAISVTRRATASKSSPEAAPKEVKAARSSKPKSVPGKAAKSKGAKKASKKVTFKASPDEPVEALHPASAPRTGIVSAVVEQLRRLGWGAANPTQGSEGLEEQEQVQLVEDNLQDDELLSAVAKRAAQRKRPAKGVAQKSSALSGEEPKKKAQKSPGIREAAVQFPIGFTEIAGSTSKTPFWQVSCKRQKFVLKSCLDVQKFLKEHGASRPGWRHLVQQPDESSLTHRQRLRLLFFSPDVQSSPEMHQNNANGKRAKGVQKAGSRKSVKQASQVALSAPSAATSPKAAPKDKRRPSRGLPEERLYRDEPVLGSRTTRSGLLFGTENFEPLSSSRLASEYEAAISLQETNSSDFSSGSDTCVAEPDDSDIEAHSAPQSSLRRSKQKVIKSSNLNRSRAATSLAFESTLYDDSEDDNVSDMSAYTDESDTAPPQTRMQQQILGRLPQNQSRSTKPKVNRGIVAAARQRVLKRRI